MLADVPNTPAASRAFKPRPTDAQQRLVPDDRNSGSAVLSPAGDSALAREDASLVGESTTIVVFSAWILL
jgi:hypothetical protein